MKFNYLHRILPVVFALAFSVLLPSAHAQYKESPIEKFYLASEKDKQNFSDTSMMLFSNLCIGNMANMNVVREQFKDQAPISNEFAKQFLGEIPGKIWTIKGQQQNGAHMFGLADQVYYCAVYSLVADIKETERLFDMLHSTAPKGAEFSLIKNERVETNNNGTLHNKVYTISTPDSPGIVVFTLNSFSTPQRGVPQTSISITVDKI